MLELRRVFSSSTSSDSQETYSVPTSPRDDSTNSSAFSASTEASFEVPGTPEEIYSPTPFSSLYVGKAGSSQRRVADVSEADDGGDISFEMRLHSLHFDALSFDPDAF
jgi:hypothetical protein